MAPPKTKRKLPPKKGCPESIGQSTTPDTSTWETPIPISEKEEDKTTIVYRGFPFGDAFHAYNRKVFVVIHLPGAFATQAGFLGFVKWQVMRRRAVIENELTPVDENENENENESHKKNKLTFALQIMGVLLDDADVWRVAREIVDRMEKRVETGELYFELPLVVKEESLSDGL